MQSEGILELGNVVDKVVIKPARLGKHLTFTLALV